MFVLHLGNDIFEERSPFLLIKRSLIVLENLTNLETNLDQLPPQDITLMIGILRLRGGSGSPAAVMALF